jgi:hypothetical protein
MKTYTIKLFTLISLVTLIPILPWRMAHSATFAPYAPRAICRIEIDNAHYSTSMARFEKTKYVKVNARSICNVIQNQVTLTVEIYKIGRLGPVFLRKFSTDPSSRSSRGLIIKMNSAKLMCKNNQETIYYGVAYSKAIIGGEWQYAGRTKPPLNIPLRCGT